MLQIIRKFLSPHISQRDTHKSLLGFCCSRASRTAKVSSQDMISTKFSNNLKCQTGGFTLLIAMVTTSMLLLVSFVVVNIALQQLVLANAAEESQHAFYAADSGTECALYWDLKNGDVSAFDTVTPGTISCGGQSISSGTQTVPTIPGVSSVVGGASVSIFHLTFTKGCAIVRVTKSGLTTTIDSRGYNTCDTSAPRRFERGVTLTYSE